MHKTSLKNWIILLTIIPTSLISLGLAGYFSYSRSIELDEFIHLRGQSIIEPLAIASKKALHNKNREQLRQLIGFTHRSQSSIVKSIVVFTLDNQVFSTSVYQSNTNVMRLKAGEKISYFTTSEEVADDLIFRTPIIEENTVSKGILNSSSSQDNSIYYSVNPEHKKYRNRNGQPIILGYIALKIDRSKINFTHQSQVIIIFSLALLGSLLSVLFSVRLIKLVTRPINSMVTVIEKIRDGKLDSRVSGTLLGELDLLKSGINAMAHSLDSYQSEMQGSIEQATTDLRESLEQFEIQNVELSIAKRKAQEANKVKSEFLANMSHELRTPLNGVIGFTRQILKTPLSDNQRDYLQTIERSANNLLTIINDILDFSKLDAGKMTIEHIPFSLRESLEETLALLAPSAHKKDINLSINIAQNVPDSLIGDVMRVKQVMTNLISNAIKFTPQGSVEIDITSEKINSKEIQLKVMVSDTGIGMNQEQQHTIFDAFTQADQSITRLYGGTGLGLVICQRLAKEMSGNIEFTSEKNMGSSFWFTFQCELNSLPMILELDNHHLANKTILYFEEHEHARTAAIDIFSHWQMNITSVTNNYQLAQTLIHAKRTNIHFDYAFISHNHTDTALSKLKKTISQITKLSSQIHIALNSNSPSLQEALIAMGAKCCLSKPLSAERISRVFQPCELSQPVSIVSSKRKTLPIKVLAVDDNEANLKLINALLLEQVAEVVLADNGAKAIALCKNETFSLIFMDIQMPVMDGISSLKVIKSQTDNNNTPVIAVTAHALSGEKEKMYQQGFDAYMTKPIDETMLSYIIYEYCNTDHFVGPDKVCYSNEKIIRERTNRSPAVLQKLIAKIDNKTPNIFDWSIALDRVANKTDLAKEMLMGLIEMLPENKLSISKALFEQDLNRLKQIIHKLSGACCYTGASNLKTIIEQVETQLKLGVSIDELEPEFFELFEHIDQLINTAPSILNVLNESPH
ncbi:MAG: two-component sensor histidine kinase BarA [Alteromonadales bacterium]|nr:two-component sensor histidine kinase BarA [Alteromonadales bacterium]